MQPLYKYRPVTRDLETRDVVRASVIRVAIRKQGKSSITFDSFAASKLFGFICSGDADMVNYKKKFGDGEEIPGTLKLDILSDDVIRVRYAEENEVPENQTAMLDCHLSGPKKCKIKVEKTKYQASILVEGSKEQKVSRENTQVIIETAKVRVLIDYEPYRLTVTDLKGKKICGVSGAEKNHFGTWDTIGTSICRTMDSQSPIAAESFDLETDECIYGLGEKFLKLNKVGQTLDLCMQDGLGVYSPRTYKNVPFHVSTHGYGVFFNHHSMMTYWVGSSGAADIQVAAADDFLDYFLMFGPISKVLSLYTDITGKGQMPPAWTFGYWQAKFSYRSAIETLEVARKLRENKVPCDVIHVDTDWFKKDWHCDMEFDPVDFPDPEGWLKELKENGFNVSLWQMPYIKEPSPLFSELAAVDGFIKTKDGEIYNLRPEFNEVAAPIDFTNPKAVEIFKRYCARILRMGVRCIKTDFGEEAPTDGVYHNGLDGTHNHNLYPLIYNKAAFEVTEEVHGPGNGVVWARSAWAGNQRYPLHWGGDVSPLWEALGPQLAGGLSFGLSGFQFWSHDIGGFLGETADHKLMTRWHQFGCLNSHARNHGCGEREIYRLPQKYFKLCRDAIRLRYKLLPYIMGQSYQCVESSLPVLRAMAVDFQNDPNTWNLADQYMFGDHLLVAPVFSKDDSRRFYLPAGEWTDWWTGRIVTGNQWITQTNIPLSRFPLYIKEGGIIGLQPVMNYVDEKKVDTLILRIAPLSSKGVTTTTLIVNGKKVPVTYQSVKGKHLVTVGKGEFSVKIEGSLSKKAKITRR